MRRGLSANAIVGILLDLHNRISDHIYDQANPEDYARRQVAKAASEATRWEWKAMDAKTAMASNVANALLAMREAPGLSDLFGLDQMLGVPVLLHALFEDNPDFCSAANHRYRCRGNPGISATSWLRNELAAILFTPPLLDALVSAPFIRCAIISTLYVGMAARDYRPGFRTISVSNKLRMPTALAQCS